MHFIDYISVMLFAQMLPKLACISCDHNGASFARRRFCSAIRSRLCSLVLRFPSWIVKRDRNSLLMIYKQKKMTNDTSQRHLSYICARHRYCYSIILISVYSCYFVSPIPVISWSFLGISSMSVHVNYSSIYLSFSTIFANIHDSNGTKKSLF